MTEQTTLDLRVGQWLADVAPAHAPLRLVEATRAGVRATRQSGPWTRRRPALIVDRHHWRWAFAAAAVVIATVGIGISGKAPWAGSSVSPTASVTYACSPDDLGAATPCLGTLVPGTYFSRAFPWVTYTVPAGWEVSLDALHQLDLTWSAGGSNGYPHGILARDGISVYWAPLAASPTTDGPLAGVGSEAQSLAAWLRSDRRVVATAESHQTLGSAAGYRFNVSLAVPPSTAPDRCAGQYGGIQCAVLFVGSGYSFVLAGPETAELFLLDDPHGTVMVVIEDVDGIDPASLFAVAEPIVNSMAFAP